MKVDGKKIDDRAKLPPSGQQAKQRVHIRWMIRRDMAEVLSIEGRVFEFPWYEEDFIRCLRQRNCIGMVAEVGNRAVGYMVYELHQRRLHVLSFAVEPSLHGRGVGRQMIQKLITKLSAMRRTELTLDVRESNLDAQLFFKALGFQWQQTVANYYEDSEEDCYLLSYELGVAGSVVSGVRGG